MARKMKPEEGEAMGTDGKPIDEERPVLANVQARQARIQEGFEELFKLRRKKEALEEQHLSDVKDQIKTLKRNLKADTDIDSKDIDLMFKLYEREQLAKSHMDDEDSERVQDNLRELFRYLKAGEMLDFVSALEEAA
ncbi:MAG: hypothetical protein KF895_03115 [Parvibaculum sp.]|nr:hypothetical protein [Parvibaculum sp.]